MNFFSNKKIVVLVNALIFTIGFNTPILMQRYLNYRAVGSDVIYAVIADFLFSLAFIYPFLYSLSIPKKFIKVLTILIYMISGISAYFIYRFKISLSEDIVASFFEASKAELLTFLNLELILGLIGAALIGWIYILTIKRCVFDKEQDKKTTFIAVVFALACLLGDADWGNNILPYNVLRNSGNYWLEKTSLVEKRLDIANNFKYEIEESSNDLNVVLIIGESARKDHFSLGGYNRETNPLLAEEKDNLIYYKNVTACYPLTRVAVPCIITRATRDNRKLSAKETSFIGVFRKLGFYTSWFGMQGTYTAIDAPYYELAKESHKALLLGTDVAVFSGNDSTLFPFVNEFFKEHQTGKNLLILHTYGSHFHYEERYTDEFRKYTPVCRKKKLLTDMSHCSLQEIINSYDNSILYTDFFVKSIIDKLRDKNAIVIYTPDHGESLGEEGRFLHGTYNSGEQIAVPMIFWVSDKYKKLYPNNVENLKKYQLEEILHDHLFHSILGCSGIKSDVIENKLNLCGNRS